MTSWRHLTPWATTQYMESTRNMSHWTALPQSLEETKNRPESDSTDRQIERDSRLRRGQSRATRYPFCSSNTVLQVVLKSDLTRWRKKKGMGTCLGDYELDCFTNYAFCWRCALVCDVIGATTENDVWIQAKHGKGGTPNLPKKDEHPLQPKLKQTKGSADWQYQSWDTEQRMKVHNILDKWLHSSNRRQPRPRIKSGLPGRRSANTSKSWPLNLTFFGIGFAKMLRLIVQKKEIQKEDTEKWRESGRGSLKTRKRERWRRRKGKSRKLWRWNCWWKQLKHRLRSRQRHLFHERYRWINWHSWHWRRRTDWLHEENHRWSHGTDENRKNPCWIETHKRMKWRLAMRIASMPEERWARKSSGVDLRPQHKNPETTEP